MRIGLIVFFFVSLSLQAQTKIDSLLQVWNNTNLANTVRTQAVYKIIWDGYMYKNLDSARHFAFLAVDFTSKKNLRKQEGEFYNSLATTYYLADQYDLAEKHYLQSLAIMEEIQFQKGIAAALTNLGTIQSVRGNHKEALEYLLRGLSIRESLNDLTGAAVALNNIGNIYRREEKFDQAVDCHKRALEIYKEKSNKRGISNSMLNLGLDYHDQSDFESALTFLNQALVIQEEINFKGGIILSLTNIGSIYTSLADYPKAIECHSRCLMISTESKDMSGMASGYNNLGIVYYYQGNYQKALKYYEDALAIRRKLKLASGISTSVNNIGVIYKKLKRYDLALEYYFEARDLAVEKGVIPVIVSSLQNISAVYFEKRDFITALDYLNQCLSLQSEDGDQILRANTISGISGVMFELNRIPEAFDWGNQSLLLARKYNANREILTAQRTLITVQMNLGNYADAIKASDEVMQLSRNFLAANFPVMTETEQAEHVKTISGDFDMRFSIALHQKETNPEVCAGAFNDVLYRKGILLKSSTATRNAILSSGDSVLIDTYQNWIVLKRQISRKSESGKSVSDLEQKADSLERWLVQSSQELSEFKNLQNQTWMDVQNSLEKGEAAVEIIHFEKKNFVPSDTACKTVYCAMVVTPECKYPFMIELFEEEQLMKLLGTYQGNNLTFINNLYGKKSEKNRVLYDLIWKPLESVLKDTKKVFISPDGLLHKISFAALSRDQDVYLCDQYKIQMMASTGTIISPDNFVFNETSVTTIFGGIDYDTDSTKTVMWNYLDGTRYETENIEQMLSEKNIPVVYLNSKKCNRS
ncbi:MAG: tetratricopeptide repeat protein [Crocinitomicaceae bacterium]|nr:tetratricopeptide repeat protein [Crocinitomicaceae bacterium]